MALVAAEQLWQREQRRVAVLWDLGIAPLTARVSAPAARPSQRAIQPDNGSPEYAAPGAARPKSTGSPTMELPSAKAAVPTPAPRQRDPLTQLPSGDFAGVQPQTLVQKTSVESGTTIGADHIGEAVAFQLLIVSAGPWLWLEQLDDALIRREQLQLVQGMARAITEGDLAPTHLQFDWPLASHAHLPRDANAARESVAGQLRRLARERQAKGIVLMGAACKEWVAVPPALLCLEIPATLGMLTTPTLKRDAWRVLRPYSC